MSREEVRSWSHKSNIFRYVKRITLMCVILMLTLGLYGCGTKKMDVSTTMTIEQDGSGSREIKMELKKEDYQTLFPNVSWESMIELVTQKCPKGVGFSQSVKEDAYEFCFVLQFDSMEDYRKQIQNIVGDAAVVRYEPANPVFASGLYFEENFTSLAMLNWLYELMEEQGTVQKDEAEALFKVGEVKLIEDGQTVVLGSDPICYDKRVVNPVERIDILTHYLANKRSDRQVIITFKDSANKNRVQLEAWLNKQLPEDVSGEWESTEGSVYVISGTNMVASSMDRLMQSILSARDSFVSIRSQQKSHIFDSVFNWEERINLSALISGDTEKIMLGYYVKRDDGMKISVQRQNTDKEIKLEKSTRYPEYEKVLESPMREVNLVTSVAAVYVVDRLEVETRLQDQNNISRNIDLFFQSEPDTEDMEHIYSKINKICEKYANVTKKVDENGNFIAIRIAQTGTIEFLNDGFKEIFGVAGQLQYAVDGKLLELKHKSIFSDTVDFTGFLKNSPEQTHMVYHLIFPSGSRINAESVSSEGGEDKVTVTKSEYTADVVNGVYLKLAMEGTIPNKTGRLLLGILLAAVILIPILIIVMGKVRRMTRRTVGRVSSVFRKFNSSFGPDDQEVYGYGDIQEDKDAKWSGGKAAAKKQPGAANRVEAGQQSGAENRAGAGQQPGAANRPGVESWSETVNRVEAGQQPGAANRPGVESWSETVNRPGAGQQSGAEGLSESQHPTYYEADRKSDRAETKSRRTKLSEKNPLAKLFGRKKAPDVPYEEQQFEADTTEAGRGAAATENADRWSSQMPEAEGFHEVASPAESGTSEEISDGYVSFDAWKESRDIGRAGNVYDMNYGNAPWRKKSSSAGSFDGTINKTEDSSDDL